MRKQKSHDNLSVSQGRYWDLLLRSTRPYLYSLILLSSLMAEWTDAQELPTNLGAVPPPLQPVPFNSTPNLQNTPVAPIYRKRKCK